VSSDGKLKSSGEEKQDRTVQDNGEGQEEAQLKRQDTMEAEEACASLPGILLAWKGQAT
jgi:hypothetical protein